MLEIEVVKSPEGRDPNNLFSNRYLIITNAVYRDPAALDLAKLIAEGERKLYFSLTAFMRVIIRGLDPRGKPLQESSKSHPLTFSGLVTRVGTPKFAPKRACAGVSKTSYNGAPAVTPYRYCIAHDEYVTWLTNRTIPARFQDPNTMADGLSTNFIEALKNAVGVGPHRHTLPFRRATPTNQPRLVEAYTTAGIVDLQAKHQKQAGVRNKRDAIQQVINELASKARYAQRVDHNGVIPDGADAIARPCGRRR